MAIERGSNAPDYQTQESFRSADAQVGAVGNRNPGSVAFDFSQRTPINPAVGHSYQLDLLKSLVGNFAPYVGNIAQNLNKNAYLEGQVAAAAKQSEEDLNANPITGDWQVAGFRDLQNRLRVADAKAQFEKDLPNLATKGPEEMQNYLDTRRATLLPALASGSGQVAEALTGQMALDERAAMAKHSDAHRAYIINNEVGALGSTLQNQFDTLKQTREKAMLGEYDPQTYAKEVESAAGGLVQSVWLNTRLDPATKIKFTKEAMEYALSHDELGYFDYIAHTPIPLPDGTTAPLSAHIGLDDWSKLADKRRTVDERVAMFRNLEQMQQVAQTEAGLKEGTYQGSYDDITNDTRRWLVSKAIDKGQYNNIIEGFMRMKGKQDNESALASAYIRGDYDTMYKLGSNPDEAGGKLIASFAAKGGKPGLDMPKQIPILIQAGQNGSAGAYKMVGERLLPSLSQMLRPDGTIDEQHKQVFNMVNDHLNSLSSERRDGAMANLLEGLPDQKKDMLLGLRTRMQDGATFGQALTAQLEDDKKTALMTPAIKAAASVTKQADITKALDNYNTMGLFDQAWNGVKSMFGSQTAQARGEVASRTSPWSDDQTVPKFAQQARDEIAMEAQRMSVTNPGLTGEALVQKAASSVAARTVRTDQGPLFLPQGTNAARVFGLPESASKEEIAAAVSEAVKPSQAGNRIAFDSAEGKIRFREFTPDGTPTNHMGMLDPKTVKPIYDRKAEERFQKYDKISGAGSTVRQNGAELSYSGRNSASVSDTWMYDFRSNLVKNEGFKDTPYEDLSGKKGADGKPIMTVGVGVSSHNPHYPPVGPDGKVAKADLDKAFAGASNDAAYSGRRVANAIGKPSDKAAFLLFSELAYQSGNNFQQLTRYRDFLGALRQGNKEQAVEAFKATPAFSASGTARQKHYINLINDIG